VVPRAKRPERGSPAEAALDRPAVEAVDTTGQAAEILDLPVHLRDALWRVDSAAIAPVDAPGGLIVAGMGGSAVGGRLALGVLGPRARRPLVVADGYALPGWAGPDTLVLCSSYSGGTEETLAAYDDAADRGAPRLVATTGRALAERARRDGVPVIPVPGGFQPRAAVGYALVAALEAAALCGAAPSLREEVEAAAALAERLAAEWGPDGAEDGDAKALARRLHGTVPVIAGAELAAPVAYRWKCQINENAALPAFASALPELDHNEIVGWPAARELGRFAAVLLEDPGAHPRNALRAELTAEQAAAGAAVVERVTARGEARAERLVSLVLLGDLVSLYLAVLGGVNPVDVAPIDALKAALAAR
jgi:glucose/mannose-6-phosphate isomerase